jgi:hypothetical protein
MVEKARCPGIGWSNHPAASKIPVKTTRIRTISNRMTAGILTRLDQSVTDFLMRIPSRKQPHYKEFLVDSGSIYIDQRKTQ